MCRDRLNAAFGISTRSGASWLRDSGGNVQASLWPRRDPHAPLHSAMIMRVHVYVCTLVLKLDVPKRT